MGFYNPSAPIILGEEWVPIREEDLIFNEQINNVEMGHDFTLTSPTQLSVARFYVNRPPHSAVNNHAYTVNVYPRGLEGKSGPIHSVIIPCNAVGVTGLPTGQIGTLDNVTRLSNQSADPDLGIKMQSGSIWTTDVAIWFAVNQYANLLANKRILGVSFLSNFRLPSSGGQVPAAPGQFLNGIYLQIRNDQNTINVNFPPYADDFSPARTNNPRVDRLGDVDRFFGGSVANTVDIMPWTFSGLSKFEATAGSSRIHMHFLSRPSAIVGPNVFINYAALEVFYCEETRVAVGTKLYNPWSQIPFLTDSPIMRGIPLQTNPVIMRDLAGTANPILPAGNYVATVNQANLGDDFEVTLNAGPHAELNSLRQLYKISGLVGRKVTIPFPLDSGTAGVQPHTMSAEDTQILPQLSLHVSGGTPFPEVHVYGRQAIGQVYGNVTVTQDILDSVAGADYFYPWVRYYARRFGETTVPLRLDSLSPTVSGSGYSVTITPAEWDALPEVLDRWKEVSLRFPDATPPVMGTGFTQQWRWSAVGEHKASRWEVLGCVAPALSGLPGNLLNLAVPPVSQLGSATYGQPSAGTSVNMGWIPQYGPYVSATVDDTTADAVLMFSQDPAPVSGFAISTLTQALSGIGQQCDLDPMGIPTALDYNRLTWSLPLGTGVASDDFTRTEAAGGWGTASDGHVWTTSGTAANFSVNGTAGIIQPSALNASRLAWVDVGGPDQDVTVLTRIDDMAESGALATGVVARLTDSSNYYAVEFRYGTDHTDMLLRRRAGGSTTDLVSFAPTTLMPGPDAWWWVRLQVQGSVLRAKVWGVGGTEPDWMMVYTDLTPLTTGNNAGVIARDNTAGADPTTFMFDSFSVQPPEAVATELQRMDTVDGVWETIMLSSNAATSGFNDYEARVGILSSYRIRRLNAYGFYGPWSVTVTATIPAPGVTVGVTGGHVLIFTTNSRQDGGSNLAYLPIWNVGTPTTEDFTFPEAGFLTLQAMYNKDYFTAFRPLERGGERFQRAILVQAAAISPETLGDFTSLRNMAWDTVPYICVRDEDGNRWFASINVPGGRVQRGRRLYESTVDIVEVSDVPSQVDP